MGMITFKKLKMVEEMRPENIEKANKEVEEEVKEEVEEVKEPEVKRGSSRKK